MRTIYVDVYFLINFTVDALALYLAVTVSHVKTRLWRIVLCAVLGALAAVGELFLADILPLRVAVTVLSLVLCAALITRKAGLLRRGKLMLLFFTVELLLGGAVSFGYSMLDTLLESLGTKIEGGAENRRALILSVLVLFSIGVIRLLIMIFSDITAERSVSVSITIADTTVTADALVDSGNLVKDPMNMNPVLFIKPELALRLVPRCVAELNDLDILDLDYRRRIRLIPVTRMDSTHVMTGIRPDRVLVTCRGVTEELDFTVAIDKEGGTFGGYEALAPLAAIKDAF